MSDTVLNAPSRDSPEPFAAADASTVVDSTVGSRRLDPEALERRLVEIVAFVIEETVSPIDRWAVAATLESSGLRDIDAVELFGFDDIFAMADVVYLRVRAALSAQATEIEVSPADSIVVQIRRFARLYLQGMFFALPMVIQIVSVLVLGYALWAYLRFDEAQATTVAVGTTLSFIVTGGFVQAIGRLGLYYGEQGAHGLAYRICKRLIRLGMLTVLAVGSAWLCFNLFSGHFPILTVLIALVYFLLLSALWLFMAVLYTTHQRLAIIVTPMVGVVVIAVVFNFTPLGIFASHWAGLTVTCVMSWYWGDRVMSRRAKSVKGDKLLAVLPRASIIAYTVAPYFFYGICYFGFLFLDRMVGWSTADEALPFLIWFRTPYELGLDWALLCLVFTIALLEYTINAFSEMIIPTQQRFRASQVVEHNRYFKKFYKRQVIALILMSLASGIMVYKAVLWTRRFDHIEQIRDFFASPITFCVFFWGAAGYGLLVVGLMNGVFFFALSRPFFVLRPIAAAIITSVVVGFVLSRTLDYWWSVAGMASGAFVFAVLTSRYVARVLNDLDYYYYSAY
ncbi:MAG: hypothetical protein RL238_3606 [Actinomycetota bacterium]|jgi:hypothetical protein